MYQYRNLPCTDLSWHIWGHDNLNKMSGVLEWCYDEADAKNRLAKMQSAGHFEDLEIGQLAPDQILYRQFNHG